MKKDIEKQFLKAYQFGGIVHLCIEVIRHRYDLGFLPKKEPLPGEWQKFYNEELPTEIIALSKCFDMSVLDYIENPLIEEIEKNLSECQTKDEKIRYIYSLLVPFNELSELLYPSIAPQNRSKSYLSELQNDKQDWQKANDKELAKKQLEAIQWFENEESKKMERLKMISNRFYEVMNNPSDIVEEILSNFVRLRRRFADRIDAICLLNQLDLMQLQKDCGTYLKPYRIRTDVDFYIGSQELAQKYIDEVSILPTNNLPENDSDGMSLSFADIFSVSDWIRYIDVLTKCNPPLLKKESASYEFIGNKKTQRGIVASWFKNLKANGTIIQNISRDELADVLNKEIRNYSISGSSIDNQSETYIKKFEKQLKELLANN